MMPEVEREPWAVRHGAGMLRLLGSCESGASTALRGHEAHLQGGNSTGPVGQEQALGVYPADEGSDI